MNNPHKLSLKEVILINLNIMLGAGIVVNTVPLTKAVGLLGCASYLLAGIFMLPLIHTIATLITIYPTGGFYTYAKSISPLLAFISCWSYFFGKLASASLILFVSATFIKQLFPALLVNVHVIPLSIVVLTIFIYLNFFNLKTGSKLQQLFFIAKSTPVLFVIISGILILPKTLFAPITVDLFNISNTIPLVLYSLSGFEAACAMSRNMQNPAQNAPKAIYYSFFIIIGIYTVFQFLVSAMLMPNIENLIDYKNTFPYITSLLQVSCEFKHSINSFINFVVGFSTLGGAYGIIFSNTWNLYTLAENRHTFVSDLITRLNKHNIPMIAVLIEGFICALFILITNGVQFPLQLTAMLGTTIAYTVSVVSLLLQTNGSKIIPSMALITCSGLLLSWAFSLSKYGYVSLFLFIFMTAFGLFMYLFQKYRSA